ncbi:MAG: maltose alpha-D-glucosyltransferase [Pirellulales bacterium]
MKSQTETRASRTTPPAAGDPQWYKDAIIYEVHVKAFQDSTADGMGDFAGLIERLDYIQDLGVTAVWLLPFYPSPLRDDGYDIADYYNIHPDYGTLRDFRQFVRQAHRRGLRVITELVINHTSDQHPWFQRARQAPPGSPDRDFYVWSDADDKFADARIIFTDTEKSNWTWDPVAKAYYWHRFFSHQPDLNFDNRRVRREVLKVLRFWLDMGVDGLRLDAVPYLIEREGTNCENLPETHQVLKELRREVDKNYQDRMLLAEANQWPADVLPYFGDADECHMAFHFPLMPRIFMAVRQEDRHPITEILRQTPSIPDDCQWALFLRNHDELTLEMVTSEERDYMYKEYAADPKMRVNIGIRRRLATLMEYNRRRIDLLHSLLFSFPGTPVLYYGDEIGMGDNIYLGDRNGVRTPMQWTGDRNAGFSRADPAKLYSPVVVDPICGFQAVNVEAQQRNPSSMLNFMKRMIALRKRYKTFGRGSIEFLHPQNRKVLAYIRRHEEETILCVANLSRFVQPAELDLSELAGMTPIEMIGHTEFPRIGELPYFVTLGPHAFYWFVLQRAPERITAQSAPEPQREAGEAVPRVDVSTAWHELWDAPERAALERKLLRPYVTQQRWFASKARQIKSLRIVDWGTIHQAEPLAFLVFVRVAFDDGEAELYLLPLALATGRTADELLESTEAGVLGSLHGPEGEAVLYDALTSDAVAEHFLHAVEGAEQWPTQSARIDSAATAALPELQAQLDEASRITRGPGGTSNSFVFFGNRLLLKLFRKLEAGHNPDIEISLYLTEHDQTVRIPRIGGTMHYRPTQGEPIAVAMIQELVANEGSGWEHALQAVGQYLEAAKSRTDPTERPAVSGRSLLECADAEPPLELQEMIGSYLEAAAILGQRTAELHLALGATTDDPAFSPEPFSKSDLATLHRGMAQQVRSAITELNRNCKQLPEGLKSTARVVLEAREVVVQQIKSLAELPLDTSKIRCHGDYHLGQVLRREGDFVILDFEGEPAKSIEERRRKSCPLKDVAGMVRSFSYAGYTGLLEIAQDSPDEFARLEPWVAAWCEWTSAAYLRSYFNTAGKASFLPADRQELGQWLDGFVLEKACYELIYELNNRPTWVRIPLVSIAASLAPREPSGDAAPDSKRNLSNGHPAMDDEL